MFNQMLHRGNVLIEVKNFSTGLFGNFFTAAFILLILLAAPSARSQDNTGPSSGVSVEVNVDPPTVTIEEIFTYSVLVRHDSILHPEMPSFESLRKLEVLDNGAEDPENFAGQIESVFWVRLRAKSVGTLTIPSIPITLYASGFDNDVNPTPVTVMTPQVNVEVESVLRLQGEPTEIRDIKPLEEISQNQWPLIAGILILIALVAAAIYIWKKRGGGALVPATNKDTPLLPHERALRELDELRGRGLMAMGNFQEHYFGLSEIFRRYLETRLRFPALDWTTEEIIGNLPRVTELSTGQKDQLSSILKNTDQVKFAKAQVTEDEGDFQAIVQFIQVTRPSMGNTDRQFPKQ
jgi:hypothetical protein